MTILSLCLSVTRWYAVKTAKHIVEILSPLNCPVILVFCDRISLRNSVRAVPNVGPKYTRNMKISQFLENKSLSLKKRCKIEVY